MTETTARHRWFRFGLRSLFTAVTLSAVFVAWLSYNLHWIRDRRNAPVFYAQQQVSLATSTGPTLMMLTCNSPWPLEWFGEPGCVALRIESSLPESEVKRIRKLFPEAEIETFLPEHEQEIHEALALHPEEARAAAQAFRDEVKAA
ncbi:MAG TPA: hypothetical protein VGJ16_02995, partial [Pirellulales bacterium]